MQTFDQSIFGHFQAGLITLDGVNIMLLWGYSIENRVSQTLALHLPKLNAGMITGLKTRLDALPKSETLAAALRIEEKCIEVSVVRKGWLSMRRGGFMFALPSAAGAELFGLRMGALSCSRLGPALSGSPLHLASE